MSFLHVLWPWDCKTLYAQPLGSVRFAFGQCVIVVCRDSGVLVLLLHFKHQLPRDLTLRAFHAVTGCDTVSQFAGHGKVTAWKAFKQNNQLLTSLGCGELTEETHSAVLRSLQIIVRVVSDVLVAFLYFDIC